MYTVHQYILVPYVFVIPAAEKRVKDSMEAIFGFLFGTREGVAALFGGGVVVFGVVAFILEKRTHKLYVDRGPKSEDEDGWIL